MDKKYVYRTGGIGHISNHDNYGQIEYGQTGPSWENVRGSLDGDKLRNSGQPLVRFVPGRNAFHRLLNSAILSVNSRCSTPVVYHAAIHHPMKKIPWLTTWQGWGTFEWQDRPG